MAEIGECSASNSSIENWAKLIPLDKKYADIEINSDETVIFSETKSTTVEKHEWCKITRNSDLNSATLQNRSSNAVLVDETVVQKDDIIFIKCGSEIVSGPGRDGHLSYIFEILSDSRICKGLKISVDVEHAKCSICLNIWHDVVTAAPCFHNFCNGCFSEWLKRSQEKRTSVLCPQCRAVVQFVGRNHFLQNIAEDILQADSSLRRSDEEVTILDSCSLIQSNLVIGSVKKRNQKRPHSVLGQEDSDGLELPCPQCGTEYAGFRCNPNTVHLQCHGCGGMMPSRFDIGIPQHCLGCDRAFCGAYWQAQRLQRSGTYATCNPETLKPISERTISRIPRLTHENNRHEQDITERCISQMGKTLQDVISEWIVKFNNREIGRFFPSLLLLFFVLGIKNAIIIEDYKRKKRYHTTDKSQQQMESQEVSPTGQKDVKRVVTEFFRLESPERQQEYIILQDFNKLLVFENSLISLQPSYPKKGCVSICPQNVFLLNKWRTPENLIRKSFSKISFNPSGVECFHYSIPQDFGHGAMA